MKFKDDVSLVGIKMEMRIVRIAADIIWAEHGQECVVTGGTEKTDKHSAGTIHFEGYAHDFRTRYFSSEEEKNIVALELRAELGKEYDVIVKPRHIHVEYDAILRG